MSDEDVDAQVIAHLGEVQQRQSPRPEPPPLRIHHLMACIVVAAIQFTLWKSRYPHGVESVSALATMLEAIRQSLNAVGLTCIIFCVYWQFKGYAGLTQPGQGLLISHAFSALELYWTTVLIGLFGPGLSGVLHNLSSGGLVAWVFAIVNWAMYLGLAAFYVWCAWRIAHSLAWRLTFVLLAMSVFGIPLSSIGMAHFRYAPNLIVAVPALVIGGSVLACEIWAVVDDLLLSRPRYWTHWIGVALSMMGKVLMILGGLINLFHWY